MPPVKRSRQKSYIESSQAKSKHNNNHRNHHVQEHPKPHVQWKDEYKFSQDLFGGESSQGNYDGPSFQPMSPANVRNEKKLLFMIKFDRVKIKFYFEMNSNISG